MDDIFVFGDQTTQLVIGDEMISITKPAKRLSMLLKIRGRLRYAGRQCGSRPQLSTKSVKAQIYKVLGSKDASA